MVLVPTAPVPIEPQICQATCAVMKLSFDEEYRRAMNELGECPSSTLAPDLVQGLQASSSAGQALGPSGPGTQAMGVGLGKSGAEVNLTYQWSGRGDPVKF